MQLEGGVALAEFTSGGIQHEGAETVGRCEARGSNHQQSRKKRWAEHNTTMTHSNQQLPFPRDGGNFHRINEIDSHSFLTTLIIVIVARRSYFFVWDPYHCSPRSTQAGELPGFPRVRGDGFVKREAHKGGTRT